MLRQLNAWQREWESDKDEGRQALSVASQRFICTARQILGKNMMCLLKRLYSTSQDEWVEVGLLILVRYAVELLFFGGFGDKVTCEWK